MRRVPAIHLQQQAAFASEGRFVSRGFRHSTPCFFAHSSSDFCSLMFEMPALRAMATKRFTRSVLVSSVTRLVVSINLETAVNAKTPRGKGAKRSGIGG